MLSFFTRQKEKRNQDEILKRMEEQLQKLEKLQDEQGAVVQDNFQKLFTRQRKSEMVTENILELLEEHTDAFLLQESIKNKEKALAEYILEYEESLHHMERMFCSSEGENSEWAKQIDAIRQQLCDRMKDNDLYIIKKSEIPIDFRMHEVVSIQFASQLEQKDKVCEIIVPGLIYQNEVVQKAKIIAYKYQEEMDK